MEKDEQLLQAHRWMGALPREQFDLLLALITEANNRNARVLQETRQLLEECEERLFAVLHRDQAQDYKDGRRYLRQYRPQLYQKLEDETPHEFPVYTIREDNVVNIRLEAVTLEPDRFSQYEGLHAAKPDDQLAARMEAVVKHAAK
jgi:hypothetical protein